jgi:ArsR family transcriptional regulator, arsenate/arsenite/antimonite-responsive transcriptional repressor
MHQFIKVVKALSDDTRLRMINILEERECCVCEVMQALKISQTRASRNLTMLYDAGFLKLRKEGLWSVYSIDNEGMPKYSTKLVESIKLALLDNETAAQDRERLKTATRTGTSCSKKTNGVCYPSSQA